jgi:putative sterol carrier protein
MQSINELFKRFKPDAARSLNATYLFSVSGEGGGSWLVKIADGTCTVAPYVDNTNNDNGKMPADCSISVHVNDLELIISGQMSAMTAALSGLLAIEGELGLAMQLLPVFFEAEAQTV